MTFVVNASIVIMIYFVSSLKNLFTSPGMRLDFQISVKESMVLESEILCQICPFYPKT